MNARQQPDCVFLTLLRVVTVSRLAVGCHCAQSFFDPQELPFDEVTFDIIALFACIGHDMNMDFVGPQLRRFPANMRKVQGGCICYGLTYGQGDGIAVFQFAYDNKIGLGQFRTILQGVNTVQIARAGQALPVMKTVTYAACIDRTRCVSGHIDLFAVCFP